LNHLLPIGSKNHRLGDTIKDQLRQQPPQEDQDRGKIGRVSHIIANKIPVSHSTYERGKLIVLKGTDEQKERLRKGDSSVTREYNLTECLHFHT